jgi:excisionase family DNA binding protein
MYTVSRVSLSVAEFCAAAGIGRSFFYQEVKAGRIMVLKAGRRTLVPTTELNNWLERLRAPIPEGLSKGAMNVSASYRVRTRPGVA